MSNRLEAARQKNPNVNNKNKTCKLLSVLRRNEDEKKRNNNKNNTCKEVL